MFLSGTMDARGFRQWHQCNRYVKKGAKAIHILVPYLRTVEEGGAEKQVLAGFGLKPVFKLEDTAGKPLDYQQIELPELPLLDRAREWGLAVKAVPGNYRYYGYYSPQRQEIGLASPEESVLFHELAHHADRLLKGKLKLGQEPLQEITAELAAATLCRLVGKQSNSLGNSYQYIENYAKKLDLSVYSVCLRVMADTEKILNLILAGDGGLAKAA